MRVSLSVICFLACIACKPSPKDSPDSSGGRKQLAELFATGQTEIRNKGNFYYALYNKDYELRFDSLPASSSVDTPKIPYVGSWYPQVYGGTGVKSSGSASALDKYDQAFNGGASKAADWERTNHSVTSGDPNSGWKGHCNGYSAAAQRHAEPLRSVTRGTTIFTPKDIKALLAETYMSAKFYFLGGNRCELSDKSTLPGPTNRDDILMMGECDDVNPGTFHIALTNWVGIQKHTIIFDISTKEQVWNYPHYKYDSTSRVVDAAEAMRLITGASRTPYTFNAQAVGFRSVATTVYYSEALGQEVITSEIAAGSRFKTNSYNYVLELDAAGKIIGGEWVGNSQTSHPDFIWVAMEPNVSDGTDKSSNPNIDAQEVIKLWAESINADPTKPPLDVMQPTLWTEWGKFPKFDLAINGQTSGTVFLGAAPKVRLTRREGLAGDILVEIKIDGKVSGSASASGSDPVVLELSNAVTPGLHQMEVSWKKSGVDSDYQRVRIHVL